MKRVTGKSPDDGKGTARPSALRKPATVTPEDLKRYQAKVARMSKTNSAEKKGGKKKEEGVEKKKLDEKLQQAAKAAACSSKNLTGQGRPKFVQRALRSQEKSRLLNPGRSQEPSLRLRLLQRPSLATRISSMCL